MGAKKIWFFCFLVIQASTAIGQQAAQVKVSSANAAMNIKDELKHESLKEVLTGIINLKEGKIGEIISRFFVDDIALAVKEYGHSIGLYVENSVYTDLAWGGLDFHNNDQLGIPAFSNRFVGYQNM